VVIGITIKIGEVTKS